MRGQAGTPPPTRTLVICGMGPWSGSEPRKSRCPGAAPAQLKLEIRRQGGSTGYEPLDPFSSAGVSSRRPVSEPSIGATDKGTALPIVLRSKPLPSPGEICNNMRIAFSEMLLSSRERHTGMHPV